MKPKAFIYGVDDDAMERTQAVLDGFGIAYDEIDRFDSLLTLVQPDDLVVMGWDAEHTEDVKRPVVNDERDVRLEHGEIEALLGACHAARNPWLAPLVEVAFETGARRGSLLRLEWRDVDLKERCATLRGVKNSRNPDEVIDIVIGLTPRAAEILEGLPRSLNGRVFPTTINALKCAFDRARDRAT